MNHYTYILEFVPTGQLYYGVRTSTCPPEDDLFVSYFSSSKVVKALIEEHGIENFRAKVRRLFKDRKTALRCEERVLRKMDVLHNDRFLNRAINSNFSFSSSDRFKGKKHSPKTKKLISEKSSAFRHSDETKKILSQRASNRDTPEWKKVYSRMGSYAKSSEHRRKLSESLKGRKHLVSRFKEVACPRCGKQGKGGGMKRWHFDNCKTVTPL